MSCLSIILHIVANDPQKRIRQLINIDFLTLNEPNMYSFTFLWKIVEEIRKYECNSET